MGTEHLAGAIPRGRSVAGVTWGRRSSPRRARRRVRRTITGFIGTSLLAAVLPGVAVLGTGVGPLVGQGPGSEIVVTAKPSGTVSKYLFGANLLWAFGAEGAFDTTTGSFYPGFVSLLRRLGVTMLRYPGGTTSDSFNWESAIGPSQDRRPNEPYGMQAASVSRICCVLDGPEPSTVGPDEFGRLLDETGAEGTITVNFVTGTAREAADFVAYMTAPVSSHPSDNPDEASYWSALRARNGHPAPYNVPYWEVGNEQVFPGQYGWRSGTVVALGPGAGRCPPGQLPTCLYAFGGTTSFTKEMVGTMADDRPSASYSTGAPDQEFYVYFPPVVPHTAKVYVGGRPWTEVGPADLATAGPRAKDYSLGRATGVISFGDGTHGEIPPAGTKVTVSYESGPHGGFVEFYRAMKAMNPHVEICESEETDTAFLQVMGHKYPYDCVELHEYARPGDVLSPLSQYEEQLMTVPAAQGATLTALQEQVRRYSGRRIPVLITEYGQLAAPVPAADPHFNLSLYEGLLIGAQVMEWARHGVPVAEKYLLDSAPFAVHITTAVDIKQTKLEQVLQADRAIVRTGLSVDSAMIAHQGSDFVAEPTGQVLGLMASLAGAELLASSTRKTPTMGSGAVEAPGLWVTAALSRDGQLEVVVINAEPTDIVTARVVLRGLRHSSQVRAYLLDGPSAGAYNTATHPRLVRTTATTAKVGAASFVWRFPAHSLSLLELRATPVGPMPARV